jgi:hypothetical protein
VGDIQLNGCIYLLSHYPPDIRQQQVYGLLRCRIQYSHGQVNVYALIFSSYLLMHTINMLLFAIANNEAIIVRENIVYLGH